MTRTNRAMAAFAVALMLASAIVTGCSRADEAGTGSQPETDKRDKPTLEEFLTADTRVGDFALRTDYADGRSIEQTGTLWIKDDLFRYDLYQDGQLIRSIMTPDGVTAYFAQHDEQVSEPSVADVAHYLRQFNAPPVESVEDGVDPETGADRVRYVVQETYQMAGSANSWYVEDIVYLVEDGGVIGIITRGGVPEEDGSAPDLQTTRRVFSSLETGVSIPDETFELPYPIEGAQ